MVIQLLTINITQNYKIKDRHSFSAIGSEPQLEFVNQKKKSLLAIKTKNIFLILA